MAPLWFSSTDRVEVAVHDLGGEGPPLILCHATGFHGRVWEPVAEALADRYRCYAPDLRGHGDTVYPVGLDLAWGGMAADLLATVDGLGVGDGDAGVRMAGWSMGGCSLVLAELARPGLVHRAWAFEPILFPSDFMGVGGSTLADGARRRRNTFDSIEDALENYGSKPPFSLCRPDALRSYVVHGFRELDDATVTLKCPGSVEAEVFEHSFSGAFERRDEFQPPVTIVASGDGAAPAQMAPAIAEAMPNAVVESMEDLTHFGPLQDPDRIADSIAAAVR